MYTFRIVVNSLFVLVDIYLVKKIINNFDTRVHKRVQFTRFHLILASSE